MKISQDVINGGMVIASCCVLYGVYMGTIRMSSLLFLASIVRYETDRERAALPFILVFTLRNTIGPVAGFFSKQFGIKRIVIFGVLLSTASIFACAFAEDIVTVTVLWGIGHGIGYGFGTLLLPHYISMHFTKHLDTANGIAMAGECVSYVLLSVLTEYLLDAYGLSGTFLILSGVMLNGLLAALLLRNPTRANEKIGTSAERLKMHLKNADFEDVGTNQKKSLMNVFRVFLDPVYIIIIITCSIMIYLFSATTTILIDVSRDHGVAEDQDVYIFLSQSIGDLIGRTVLGSLTGAGCLTKINLSALCFAGIGCLYAACTFIKGFIMMIVFSFFFGLFIGGLIMIGPGIVTLYVEKHDLSVAIASRLVLYSPMSFTQAPLIGYFRDVLQSYNALFYILMGLSWTSCIASLLIPPLSKYRRSKTEPLQNEASVTLSLKERR